LIAIQNTINIYNKKEIILTIKQIYGGMSLKFESKLSRASTKSNVSTKTTVPKPIMDLFNLEWGDKIVWIVEKIGDDEVKVCVVPKKE